MLTIVANIYAKEDQVEFVKSELIKLIDTTLAEKGCIQYDLHQDNQDPRRFMFYENWEDKKTWHEHINAHHIKNYSEVTKDAVERQTFQMTKIV